MVKRSSRSDAQERAAVDRAYLEQVRGGHAALPSAPDPGGVPEPPAEVMPHMPTAAPSPSRGVSPILGEQAQTSPPPVGSFLPPPVGPPNPAYPSGSTQPSEQPASGPVPPSGPVMQSDSGTASDSGGGRPRHLDAPGQPSFIEQSPLATMPAPQPYSFPDGQGADLPLLLGPNGVAPSSDLVTCPECGEIATVDAAKRQSEDFCRKCDFPLFWARSTVVLPSGAATGASLRRLPGTVGRAATAALMCPHCGEPNSPAAQNCVRCLLSLHPVEAPEPEPVYLPPPEPEPEPVPEPRGFPMWWLLLVLASVVVIVLLVAWGLAN